MYSKSPDIILNRPIRCPPAMTLTIGIDKGDLRGSDGKIIQAGVDYLGRLGGGILQILPGQYTLTNFIYAHSNVTIRGCGEQTILKKADGFSSPLVRETDWCEYGAKVKDTSGFVPGGSIMLRSKKDDGTSDYDIHRATVTQIDGNFIFFIPMPKANFPPEKNATADTIFPLIYAEHVDNVRIEDLVLDGNGENNRHCDGNYTGAVFTQSCNRWQFKNVTAKNYNGDGFSFQVCDDFAFENCLAIDNADLGFHPGSGSQRPILKNCKANRNGEGFFFCWDVTDGIVENCESCGNKKYGINFGHRDTDNIVKNCLIEDNGEIGILFREETPEFKSAHRNRIEKCLIINNGNKANGVNIEIANGTDGTIICDNRIENTLPKNKCVGIRICSNAGQCCIENNSFVGCSVEIEDLRRKVQ